MLLLFSPLLPAGGKGSVRPSFSVEWGYKANLFHVHHYNYLTSQGTRVDDRGTKLKLFSDGEVLGSVGIDFLKHFNTSVFFGYAGIDDNKRVFPLSGRFTYFFNDYSCNGAKIFADYGIAFGDSFNNKLINLGRLGGGYRFALSEVVSLDLNFNLEYVQDYPSRIIDKYNDEEISGSSLRRSELSHFLAVASISLNF